MSSETAIGLAPHPAAFNQKVMSVIRDVLHPLAVTTILDPFVGIGRIHQLRPRYKTYGIEVEPEWAHHEGYVEKGWTLVANMLDLPGCLPETWPETFDAIVTSPSYGNRMADHHDAKDGSERNTYKHKLGRDLSRHNSGAMQWGEEYRRFHEAAWIRVMELVPNGVFVLNIKDHIRGGKRMRVTEWHVTTLMQLGWRPIQHEQVPVRGNRNGANADVRIDYESVFLFDRRR